MWQTAISARREPAKAVVDGAHTWSYAELAQRVAAHRSGLERDGVRPGQTVALLADKSAHSVAATLALAEIGATVFLAPRGLGPELLADLLSRSGADYAVQARTSDPDVLSAVPVGRSQRAADCRAALLLSTSGSTGVPKLVPLLSSAVERFAAWAAEAFGIGPGVRVLSYAPLNFDLSLLDVWATLMYGGTTVLVPPQDAARAERVAGILVARRPEIVQAVPLLLRLLAAHDVPPQPQVRHLVLTGEAFPVEHWPWLRRTFPSADVWNLYGCTETNDSFRHRVTQADIDARRVPIGRPLPGVVARIDGGGAEGELLVSTPFQTPGYLHQLPDDNPPFFRLPDSDRVFYRTGDIVHRTDDGAYHLVDRISRIVKVNGVRTSLAEVESVLADHPDVAEAVVFAVPDSVAGTVLHAAVLPRDQRRPDTLALRGHCRRRLAASAVPSRYHVLPHDLPRTPTGKPDRVRIQALLTEGAVL
ncbi:MAG: AMP-binding protein [Catenulispora sp.]|nr:AMP-binding protein [Catenulispora sp.]